MNLFSKIYVAGHRGLVGSALVRRLGSKGYRNILGRPHGGLDLESGPEVREFFAAQLPDFVFLAAARVGGIHANSAYPADFLLRNLKIQTNVVEAAWRFGVKGLLFLGSSCIYPKLAPQPLREEYLLSGPLEPTNEPYAIAKIAGVKLCEAYNRQYGTRFLSVMPTNLYGPNDNYDLEDSHVLPAFIRKFHLAKTAARGDWRSVARDAAACGEIPGDFARNLAAIARFHRRAVPGDLRPGSGDVAPHPAIRLWGTGSPRREFLYSDDLADACILLMERLEEVFGAGGGAGHSDESHPPRPGAGSSFPLSPRLVNVGCGKDLRVSELAKKVSRIVGFDGPIEWDAAKSDGTPRKLLDSSKMAGLGWAPSVGLDKGIRIAYADYLRKLNE